MIELRRLDEDFKVMLDSGETTLGRGPLLQIDATNISRKHALLSVSENSDLTLTCLHKNPIFFKKRGEWSELAKDEEVMLENEDEVKFLSDSFHFKVYLHVCKSDAETAASEDTDDHGVDNDDPAHGAAQVLPSSPPNGLKASKKRKLPDWMLNSHSKKLKTQSTDNGVLSTERNKESISEKQEASGFSVDAAIASTSKLKVKAPMKDAPAKIKESFSPNKPKDGAPTVFPVPVTPSDILNSDDEDEKENMQGKMDKNLRQSCAFGSSCYRKNPVHRVEEAHPGDDDFKDPSEAVPDDDGGVDKPECEFGTDCYRKNPDHRKQFKHSIRPQPKRGAKVKVTKKKKVKAAKKKKGLDEYESEDSFIDDDEEDDWSPVDDSDDDEDWAPKLSPEYEDE